MMIVIMIVICIIFATIVIYIVYIIIIIINIETLTVLQKYSRRIFFNIGIIRKLTSFTGKHLCRDVFLISFKKKLQYRCFPVRFVNFLKRYNLSQNTSSGCVWSYKHMCLCSVFLLKTINSRQVICS